MATLKQTHNKFKAGVRIPTELKTSYGGNPNGAAAIRRAAKGNGASVAAIKGNADAFAESLRCTVGAIRASGVTSLAGIAEALSGMHMKTARAGQWHASSVRNLLGRLGG